MASTIKLNMIIRPWLVSSITIVKVTPQFGAYLTIIIYDHKTFIVQVTGFDEKVIHGGAL
jgi:hypothetical protein